MSIDEKALEYAQRNAATIDTDPSLVKAIIGWYTNHIAKTEQPDEKTVDKVAGAIHDACAEIDKPYPTAIPCFSMNKNKEGWRIMARAAIASMPPKREAVAPPDRHDTQLFGEIHRKCREEMWAYTLHFNEASGTFDFSVTSLAPAEDFNLSDSRLPYILQEIDNRRRG